MMKQGISIIVCCYNSADRLPETLEHIAVQQCNPAINWEVIVVNNGSTDSTASVAQNTWQSLGEPTKIAIVEEPRPGLSHARTCGVTYAAYSYISFIDDDNWIDKNWVQTAFSLMNAHPEWGAVGSRNIGAYEEPPPVWFNHFAYLYAIGEQQLDTRQEVYELWGAGLTFRKEVWCQLEKCDVTRLLDDRTANVLSSGGDSEICMLFKMLGYKLNYVPELTTHHFMPVRRLEWSYTRKLLTGIAHARFPLAVYTRLCKSNQSAARQTSLYWLVFCGKCLLIAAYGWSRWKLSLKSTEGNPYYAKFLFYKSVFKVRNYQVDRQIIKKIHQNYLTIQRCKQIVNEPPNR